jgi:uncharacterized membrane protein YqjE
MIAEIASRSTGELLKQGFDQVREILRSEVALARAEVREEASQAAKGVALAGAASVFVSLGLSFLLWMAFWALATALPAWASAGIVACFALVLGAAIGFAAYQYFRRFQPPVRTKQSLQENYEWVKKRAQ